METLKIKPGSFLLWKEHSRITKLFSKLFHKELPYNNFSFFLREIELCFPITKGNNNYDKLIILEPKEDYTKEEINLLNSFILQVFPHILFNWTVSSIVKISPSDNLLTE